MLTNDKNFRFKQIPDKTDEMIFLKSPKNLFLGLLWPFLFIFSTKIQLCHTQMGP